MQRSRARKSDVYRVERLVAKRTRSNRVEFLVKWKNWSEAHNSWEPEKNILDKRLIESFERREKRKKTKNADSSAKLDTSQSSLDLSTSTLSSVTESKNTSTLESVATDLAGVTLDESEIPEDCQDISNLQLTTVELIDLQDSQAELDTLDPLTSVDATTGNIDIASTTTPKPATVTTSPIHSAITTTIVSSASDFPAAVSTSAESNMSPPGSQRIQVVTESFFDLPSDRRFRHSTMIAAAASASLASSRRTARQTANTNANLNSVGNVCTFPRPTTSTIADTAPLCRSLSEPDAPTDERPKIRITIPRDILLTCPHPLASGTSSVSGSTTSSRDSSQVINNSPSMDEKRNMPDTPRCGKMEDGIMEQMGNDVPVCFLAPVEVPRRSALSTNNMSPISILSLRTGEPTIVADQSFSSDITTPANGACRSPTKWTTRLKENNSPVKSLLFPKLTLVNAAADSSASHGYMHHRKRHLSDDTSNHMLDDDRLVDTGNVSSQQDHIRSQIMDESAGKRRKHSDRKEKRRRKRIREALPGFISDAESTSSSFDISPTGFPTSVKVRRRSGSSNSHASTLSSSDGLSPTPSLPTPTSSDDTPRVAPLRIQLRSLSTPGSGICTNRFAVFSDSRLSSHAPVTTSTPASSLSPKMSFTPPPSAVPVTHGNRLRDRSNRYVPAQPRVTLLTPDPKKLRLVQEICVTDVTVDGLTISIKECSGPDDFFGVPSSQLVQWTGSKLNQSVCSPVCSPGINSGTGVQTTVLCSIPSQAIKPECDTTNISNVESYRDENVAPSESILAPHKSQSSHPVCDLSTIYEEPSSIEASRRSEGASLHESPTRPPSRKNEALEQPQNSPEPVIEHTVESNEPEVPSTSALMLAATEAALKSSEEPSTSPGLLTPPRRASTPVSQESFSMMVDTIPTSHSSTSTTPAVFPTVPSSSTTEASTTTVTKATSSPVSTVASSSTRSSCSSPSKAPIISHPTGFSRLTVVSSGRSRGSIPIKTNLSKSSVATGDSPRRLKTRDPSSLALVANSKVSRPSAKSISHVPRSSAPAAIDPASVYVFSDSSPTRYPPSRVLSSRASGMSSSPHTNSGTRRPASASSKLPEASPISIGMPLSSAPFSSGMTTFSPFTGVASTGPQSFDCPSLNNTPGSLGLPLPNLTDNPADSAFATAIYLQQLRMQLLGVDSLNSPTNSAAGLNPMVSCVSSVSQWAAPIQFTNSLTTAFGSFIPSAQNLMGSGNNTSSNENFFNPNFPPFSVGTGSTGSPGLCTQPTRSSPVPTSSTLVPNLMLPAQLQLADMVAAAVSQSVVFNTSSSRELYPSTERPCSASVPISVPSTSYCSDESPMDLSAKR